MEGLIYKVSICLIPRNGLFVFLSLALGLYFIFPATRTFLEVYHDKNEPTETVAISESKFQGDQFQHFELVKAFSPALSLNSTITYKAFRLNTEVKCITSDYISANFSDGCIFPDFSSMPYIVLNSWAAEHFIDDDGQRIYERVASGAEVKVIINGKSLVAEICGIYDDKEEEPIAYMSYYFASQIIPQTGNSMFLITLHRKGNLEKVVTQLRQQGFTCSYDPNNRIRWETLESQSLQCFLTSAFLLLCCTILWGDRIILPKQEIQLILLFGFHSYKVKKFYTTQIWFCQSLCLLLSIIISLILNSFSLAALVICLLLIFLQFQFLFHNKIRCWKDAFM